MARTRKSIQPLDLRKYDVLIEDRAIRSDYFKITQFDGYFYGGRNAFLIAGAPVLNPNSKVLVEILNVNGDTVYSAPVANFVEGNSRLIQVEVYNDTPIGPGKIIVLGSAQTYLDGTPVPSEWSDKFNVRWITDVIISPLINNKTPIRFINDPSVDVDEKFYPVPATASFSQSVAIEFGDYELSPINYNIFQNGYLIKLKNPTNSNAFKSEHLNGLFITSTSIKDNSEFISGSLPITKIFNSTTAESRGQFLSGSRQTKILQASISGSGSNYVTRIEPYGIVTASASINKIQFNKIIESPNTGSEASFAKIRITNLNTLSGEINKVRVYYKIATEPGDFTLLADVPTQVEELLSIDSGSKILNVGSFQDVKVGDYWYASTMSLSRNQTEPILPNYYYSSSINTNLIVSSSSDVLLDSIFVRPEIDNFTYKDSVSYFIGSTNNNKIELFPNSEYTLKFTANFRRISESISLSQSDYSMEVYLISQETSTGTLLEKNSRGQLLGTLTPVGTQQLFENIELNFRPKINKTGTFGLRFVVYGGFWNIASLSVKVAEEPLFSPDEVAFLVPTVNLSNKLLTFKTEFLDIDNNSSDVSAVSIPVFFTGSSDYVKKSGDYMTGELYINNLPIQQQALQDSFTGLVSGGIITVNTPASWSYTISSGSGYVVDNYTDPLNPTYTYVTWPQITKMPAAFVTTGSVASYPRTNIAISASGQVIEQSAEWTPQDYRKYIILGRIAHVGTTFIQRALSLPLTSYNRGFHWFDLANAIGILNVEGNVYYPSGSSMSIGKTAGKTYRVGSNYRNDTTFPDITTDPASLPTIFAYRYRSGSGFKEEPLSTIISGALYDDGSGVLQTVNPNKFTIQRIYYFGATNTTRIQFGQNVYDTLVDAQSSADAEVFVADPNLDRDSSLRAYLIVGSSATDLSDPSNAEFITIGKFGAGGTGGGGGGGGATALSGLTDVNLSGPSSGQLLQYNGTVWVNGTNVTTLATTGSNNFLGNQTITGSLIVSGSSTLTNIGPAIFSGSLIVTSGITGSLFGTSSFAGSASRAITSSNAELLNGLNSSVLATTGSNVFLGNQRITGSLILSSSALVELQVIGETEITGSLRMLGGITGSLFGTSSRAISASTAVSASWAPVFPFTGNAVISGSLVVSGSATSSLRVDSSRMTVSGSASFSGPIAGTHAVFSQMYDENATVAGLYLGRNTSDNTPRVGFFNGTTAQNWQIDNASGQFRWYTPSVTRMTLTTSAGNTVLRLLGAGSVITSEGSISASNGITGSLFGTSSWAISSSFATSASWAPAAGLSGGTTNYVPLWTGTGTLSSSAIFQSAGNVGIGTTSPLGRLHVSGANDTRIGLIAGSTRAVRIGADTAAAYVEGVDQTGVGSYQPLYVGGSTTSLLTGGTERWRVDSSGNLIAVLDNSYDIGGSGVTRPRTLYLGTSAIIGNNPGGTGALRVAGNVDITDIGYPGFRMFVGSTQKAELVWGDPFNALYFQTFVANSTFGISRNGTYDLYITSSGDVGIGTLTPTAKLHVQGNVSASSYTSSLNNQVGFFGTASHAVTASFALSAPGGGLSGGTTNYIPLWTGTGTLSSSVMFQSSSNVGVGTVSPSAPFHVFAGASSNTLPTNTQGIFEFSANGGIAVSTPAANAAGLYFPRSSDAYYAGIERDVTTLQIRNNGATRIAISSSGNVGIGTTTPSSSLHVIGAITATTESNSTSSLFTLQNTRNPGAYTGSSIIFTGATSSVEMARISSFWSSSRDTDASLSFVIRARRNGVSIIPEEAMRIDRNETGQPRVTIARNGDYDYAYSQYSATFRVAGASYLQDGLMVGGRALFDGGVYLRSEGSAFILWSTGSTNAQWYGSLPPTQGGLAYKQRGMEIYAGNLVSPRLLISSSGNIGIGTTTPQTILDISGSGGIRHTSGSVTSLLRANPTTNAVEFGAETFHVVNMLINGSSLYQFGIGSFVTTNNTYTLGAAVNPWASVFTTNVDAGGRIAISGSTGISHGMVMTRTGWGSLFRLGAVSSSGDDFWITSNWNPSTGAQDTVEQGLLTLAPKNELRVVVTGTRVMTVTNSGVNLADNQIIRPILTDYAEKYSTPAISANTLTLNIENGNVFRTTLNANINTGSFTISNPSPTGNACSFTLIFDANGTGYAVNWPSAVKWPGGTAPTLTTTSGRSDMFVFYTNNAGTTWYAMTAGQNFVTT